jgi:murein L,D-transpeptidase YcbB/YkuD
MTRLKLTGKGIAAFFLIVFFLCAKGYSLERNSSVQQSDSSPGLLIKKRITEWRTTSGTVIEGERIYTPVLVKSFYEGRQYQPAWSRDGHLMQAGMLIRAVEEAYGDGLTPDYYHLQRLKTLVAQAEREKERPDPMRLGALDILLTDAFLTLGCHLSAGCVDPVTLEPEWNAKRGNVDVSSVLEQALKKKKIREALTGLRPEQGAYAGLGRALAGYRALLSKGEWPLVPDGPLMKKGYRGTRVVELRTRLSVSGDLDADEAKGGDLFDEKLERSVIIFQKRHGLKVDGIVGPETLTALHVPLKQRIRQIELNMERLRWIGGNLGPRSIVINIANFELYVIEGGKSILSMKVVVGKPYWDTPVFSARITHLVLNPSWNVPDSIAKKELLKKIKKDPDYLSEQEITVLRGWGDNEEEIDPETVDWSRITPENLIYRFRQEPGILNPLGRIKFMLPNKFDVYLHDTPAKRLFSEHVRIFSHGCIRIEKPVELADYVLQDDPKWTREKILTALEKGNEQIVRTSHPVNVHFLYLTAWVDERGTLQFRNDIYERDKRLDEALLRRGHFP